MAIVHRHLFVIALTLLPMAFSRADLVLVVNPRSGVETMSRSEAINIFMGRFRQLPSGILAEPIDQPDGSPEKRMFYRLLVNKDLSDIRAYWTRLVFSGKTRPPRQSDSSAEIGNWLADHVGAVAYMERGQVDHRARIVLELER
jgi:hypothetical protein